MSRDSGSWASEIGRAFWPLVSAATMRDLDRYSIQTIGVSADLLMENAGRAVADTVQRRYPTGRVLVVCGAGNNGGDGLVVARHLLMAGRRVESVLLAPPEGMSAEAACNLERLRACGYEARVGLQAIDAALVVDAIFGTGLSRPVVGVTERAINAINASSAAVLSVDLPSGVDADTGQILGTAVRADTTVTVGLPKIGLCFAPARELAGDVVVARIGIVDATPEITPDAETWRATQVRALLPERQRAGHKGSFGHVLVVAGSTGKSGAAALCALGVHRAGAGLVTVACPAPLLSIIESTCTEAMTLPQHVHEGGLGLEALSDLIHAASERDVTALGPGLGRAPETQKLVSELAAAIEGPLVLDADGLTPFSGALGALRSRQGHTILTPHPGEAARLLGLDARGVNADRLSAARRLAEESGAVVVLKGAGTVIADPEGELVVNTTGGPNLGAGGSGDVLAGIVAALLAQGASPSDAAALGAWLHGAASDLLAGEIGDAGVLARELADAVPRVLHRLRADDGERDGHDEGSAFALAFP